MVFHVFGGGATFEVARGTGEETNLVGGGAHLVFEEAIAGLARVFALDVGELVGTRLKGVGNLEQRHLTFAGGGLFPLGEGSLGCRVRAGHILLRGIRDGGVDLSG